MHTQKKCPSGLLRPVITAPQSAGRQPLFSVAWASSVRAPSCTNWGEGGGTGQCWSGALVQLRASGKPSYWGLGAFLDIRSAEPRVFNINIAEEQTDEVWIRVRDACNPPTGWVQVARGCYLVSQRKGFFRQSERNEFWCSWEVANLHKSLIPIKLTKPYSTQPQWQYYMWIL